MKSTIHFLALTILFFGLSVNLSAQNTSNTFKVGSKQIVIPPPEGFSEAASKFQSIKDTFTVTEAEGNELLSVFIPNSDYQLFNKGEFSELTFYTKVAISKKLKDLDLSETDFAGFAEAFKKYFPAYIDPQGSEMKKTLGRISENLSSLNKANTTFSIEKPFNLGEIVNDRNSFGVILLSQIKRRTGNVEVSKMMLMGASAIRVKEKIIFVYTYKDYKSEPDITDFKTFSSNWLKQIAAGNK